MSVGLVCVVWGLMQMPGKSPMKSGLWEMTTSSRITLPGGTPTDSPVLKSRICISDDTWKRAFGALDQKNCTHSHEVFSGRVLSFDLTCPKISAHEELTFSGLSSETAHGKVHLEMNIGGKTVSDSVIDARYVGSNCGGLEPGKAELE